MSENLRNPTFFDMNLIVKIKHHIVIVPDRKLRIMSNAGYIDERIEFQYVRYSNSFKDRPGFDPCFLPRLLLPSASRFRQGL